MVRETGQSPSKSSGKTDSARTTPATSIGIVDMLYAAGISSPDISIVSEEFLNEIDDLDKKHLALEALRQLLDDEIRERRGLNIVETRNFSERLENAITRYHTNAINTVEALQELINLAWDIREARIHSEEEGLSNDEIALYDAIADNESAVNMVGNDSLKVIAHELLTSLKENIIIDWTTRGHARARQRVLVKRILRKHGYPPDMQQAAVQAALGQIEAISARCTN